MINVVHIQLSSGYEFPLIGYGTFGGSDGPSKVYTGTKHALESGYRHFDTAYLCKSSLFHASW
jgi:diketogulonate reductase-like aldo/keto reductase